jgi:hypothetical protein
MDMIRSMQSGLRKSICSSEKVLSSAQKMIEECGENLRQWFGALSGRALEEAIKEVCQRFDLHGSGHIGQQEFAKAMHFLGLRLTAEQYNILFSEYDLDGSGEIDVDEFSTMVKKFLKTPCLGTCKLSDGSNQPCKLYHLRWCENELLLDPAASTLQTWLLSGDLLFLRIIHRHFIA